MLPGRIDHSGIVLRATMTTLAEDDPRHADSQRELQGCADARERGRKNSMRHARFGDDIELRYS